MLIMKKFFTLRDQCILKNSPWNFSILDPRGGGLIDVNLKGLLVYFLLHGKTSIEEVENECRKLGIDVDKKFLKKLIKTLLQANLIELRNYYMQPPFRFSSVIKNAFKNFKKYPAALSLCELELSVTNKCTYRCTYCYRGDENKNVISLSCMKKVIEDASEFGTRTLFLTGGEPLLEINRVKKLARWAVAKKFTNICIATSGIGLSSEIAEELRESGINSIIVKLDSISHKTFSKITQYRYAFYVAKNAIEIGKKYFDEVIANMTVVDLNKGEIDKVVEWAMKNGVNRIKISPPIPTGRASDFYAGEEFLKNIIQKANFYKKIYGNLKVICPYSEAKKYYTQTLICLAGTTLAFVSENGNMSVCPYFINKLVISNVTRERFKSVWPNHPLLQKFREPINVNPQCMRCKKRYYCIDNCRFLSFLRFNSLTMESKPQEC